MGSAIEEAFEQVQRRFVFTTHTPVAAGNETYAVEEFLPAYADLRERLGLAEDAFLDLFRGGPGEGATGPG